ncbi:hypothetical protein K432DRAFT_383566 [Lepidopterella palustris CBS 459.81]|uniref:Uncharacterized protein n=1 Tax=Lepidopterella palustris CBS 459.81 TaxID=1314670 RepID=A0A8E2E7N9_9PEZI|nr:hypothetical protein K432DRAFT_383566 [Lepidopterella palustris CBS 459.81]
MESVPQHRKPLSQPPAPATRPAGHPLLSLAAHELPGSDSQILFPSAPGCVSEAEEAEEAEEAKHASKILPPDHAQAPFSPPHSHPAAHIHPSEPVRRPSIPSPSARPLARVQLVRWRGKQRLTARQDEVLVRM